MERKNDAGFTLIELVVTLVCCSIVTLAVMTVLLTGTRIGRAAEKSSGEQQTVRIVLTALENMIGDGTVKSIRSTGDDWQLMGESDTVLLSYSGAQGALLTSGGTPLLDGLTGATAELGSGGDDEEPGVTRNLLTVTVELDGEKYPTTVYCRVAPGKSEDDLNSEDKIKQKVNSEMNGSSEATYPARKAFLTVAASQYGSTGSFSYEVDGEPVSGSFSKWYNSSWSDDTPWCMTFLSWVANMTSQLVDSDGNAYLATGDAPYFAHVDKCMAAFKAETCGKWGDKKDYAPIPGDFIFFDWEWDGDPDHVGVVLSTDANGIYTIEGNSGGKVAVRYYPANDARIVGYGVLNWKTTT